jgi:Cu2+-exporting ATPase
LKVKGMMCEHCEARVKAALEKLPQVECATADYRTGLVEVELREAAENRILKKTVENEDYKVLGIK